MDLISKKAASAIKKSQVVVGYRTYINLLGGFLKNKEVVVSGMGEEVKRANYAIKEALNNKRVCVISSGDPGIYGMAGLVLELLNKNEEESIEIEIIPGIPAASSCAALLGAPIAHDFAVISLSDLLTDARLIEKRVEAAAKGDFAIVFYNPRSRRRTRPLERALEILIKYRSPDTPCGIVRNAGRKNQEIIVTVLKDLALFKERLDMRTTLIIGNSRTFIKGKYIVTPRGYALKYNLERNTR